MRLSVIIVSYNVKSYLEQCLYSVQRAVLGIESEIIVVDNQSSDGSIEWLRPRFDGVRFIANDSNLGFARANNIALAEATGNYILLLNPDTLLAENLAREGLGFLATHQNVGALGFRMIDGYGTFLAESKRSFPSPLVALWKVAGLAKLFPGSGFFNKYALGDTDSRKSQQVDVLAGACMLVRREILDQLKGFDEDYFMYGEDIDLSYRIQHLGFNNHYFAGAEVLHFKGASSRNQQMSHIRNFYGAMLVFVKKHYTSAAAAPLVFFLKAAIALKAAFSLFGHIFLPKGVKTFSADNMLLVGTEEEYEETITILQKWKKELKLPMRVSVTNIKGNAVCSLPDLNVYAEANYIDSIVFCAGTLTLSSIFQQLQLPQKRRVKFFFHMAGSEQIVGTDWY